MGKFLADVFSLDTIFKRNPDMVVSTSVRALTCSGCLSRPSDIVFSGFLLPKRCEMNALPFEPSRGCTDASSVLMLCALQRPCKPCLSKWFMVQVKHGVGWLSLKGWGGVPELFTP